MTDIRVTREAIEVLSIVDTDPAIQATRMSVEVLSIVDTAPIIRMTRFSTEVLHSTALESVGGLRRTIITVNYS